MNTDTSVNQEGLSKTRAKSLVLRFVSEFAAPVTKQQIQLSTGISLFHCEDAIDELIKDYPCRLHVNNDGYIVYDFDLKHPRKLPGYKEKLKEYLYFAKKILIFLFKFIISIVFVIYFGFYGAVIALIITALTKGPQGIILWAGSMFEAFRLLFHDVQQFFTKTKKEYIYKPPKKGAIQRLTNSGRSLIASVHAFVLGETIKKDELEKDKLILEYLRCQEFKITATELTTITGWDLRKSEEELTQMLTHYKGKVYVDQQGSIIYHFPELADNVHHDSKDIDIKSFFCWKNPLEYIAYNSNEKEINKGIHIISLITLIIFSLTMIFSTISFSQVAGYFAYGFVRFFSPWHINTFLGFLFVGLPYFFFPFFYLLAYITRLRINKKNAAREKQNRYNVLLHNICKNLPDINASVFNELPPKQRDDVMFYNNGETFVNDNAEIIYRFRQMADEIRSIENERKQKFIFSKLFASPPANMMKYTPQVSNSRLIFKTAFFVFFIYFFARSSSISNELRYNKVGGKSLKYNFNNKEHRDMYKPNSLRVHKWVTLLNPTKEYPVPYFDSLNYCRSLTIVNAEPGSFKLPEKMKNLETLTIRNSGLTKVPEQVQNYKNLRYLYLENNAITEFPEFLIKMPNLSSFDAENNKIKQLPPKLYASVSLKTFSLKNNKIEVIPDSLYHSKILYLINLDDNPVKELAGELPDKERYKYRHTFELVVPNTISDELKERLKLAFGYNNVKFY